MELKLSIFANYLQVGIILIVPDGIETWNQLNRNDLHEVF